MKRLSTSTISTHSRPYPRRACRRFGASFRYHSSTKYNSRYSLRNFLKLFCVRKDTSWNSLPQVRRNSFLPDFKDLITCITHVHLKHMSRPGRVSNSKYNKSSQALPLRMLKYIPQVVNEQHMGNAPCVASHQRHPTWPLSSTSMRLVLTHSARHFAPKRHARYTPMPATPPGVSFLCFERIRMVKTIRFAPARSLMDCVSVILRFASLHPSTSSASLSPTASPPLSVTQGGC